MRKFYTNIGQLISLEPLAKRGYPGGEINEADLGIVEQAWLAVENKKIIAYGSDKNKALPSEYIEWPREDCKNALIMPALIDSHAHLVFAGSRANDFSRRIDGESYQSIAAGGGGIQSTISATRKASNAELLDLLLQRLAEFRRQGIMTVEVKTGYGLSVKEELRHLTIIQEAKNQTDQELYVTCLALHDRSPDFSDQHMYIKSIVEELIPEVKKQKLADAFDAFIETGYFSAQETAPYFMAVRSAGFSIRIHADEFSNSEGAKAAANFNAKSADHLQHASKENLRLMAQNKVTATILPGTSLYTKIPFRQADEIRQASCALAVATDFNPGSCQLNNLHFLSSLAALHCGLRAAEAIAAVTYNAAYSLSLNETHGSISKGLQTNLLIYNNMNNWHQWLADMGRSAPRIL